jgi:hypothetical protein
MMFLVTESLNIQSLLYIAFIIYLMIMSFAFIFKIKWLFMIAGFLWFIPITQIDNTFIVLISVVMFIVHSMLGFYEKKESDF